MHDAIQPTLLNQELNKTHKYYPKFYLIKNLVTTAKITYQDNHYNFNVTIS